MIWWPTPKRLILFVVFYFNFDSNLFKMNSGSNNVATYNGDNGPVDQSFEYSPLLPTFQSYEKVPTLPPFEKFSPSYVETHQFYQGVDDEDSPVQFVPVTPNGSNIPQDIKVYNISYNEEEEQQFSTEVNTEQVFEDNGVSMATTEDDKDEDYIDEDGKGLEDEMAPDNCFHFILILLFLK